MLEKIFSEVVKEARNGKINLFEEFYDDKIPYPLYLKFNLSHYDEPEMLNIHIKNSASFYKKLELYVRLACKHYGFDYNDINIKVVIARMFANVTSDDILDLELYLDKYISFFTLSPVLMNTSHYVNDEVGYISSIINKQSIEQETPFCFKSKFELDDFYYNLPRISFGIKDNVCYIYAVQNKDKNIIDDNNIMYCNLVKNNIRTINKSINKYRNVTPSFVVAVANFISIMRKNGINKFKVVAKLPLSIQNRTTVTRNKIESKRATLSIKELDNFKNMLEQNNIRNNKQSTIGLLNLFNRLKIHFYDSMNIIPSDIDSNIYFKLDNLVANNQFLNDIVGNSYKDMIK